MKVHLFKSENVDSELIGKVVDLLRGIKGPLIFLSDEKFLIDFDSEEMDTQIINERKFNKLLVFNNMGIVCEPRSFPLERETTTWQNLFKKIDSIRTLMQIPNDEFVILLTDVANEQNWFGLIDERNATNGFIHTADWDYFLKCNLEFPIAYMVISLILQKHMFSNMRELIDYTHKHPMGCINDFCENKKDIILKLRTADICIDCFKLIQNKIETTLLNQCISILDHLRVGMMYSQNFRQTQPASSLHITKQNKIFLTDYNNIEIKLRPLEKALYFLYLNHAEGIKLTSLPDYKEELQQYYLELANTGLLAEIHNKINILVNVNSNSASEKISRIKAEFESKIGEQLSKQYIIQGGNGEVKGILLNREMVILNNK